MVDLNTIYLYKIARITNVAPLPPGLLSYVYQSPKKEKSPELQRLHKQYSSIHIKKIYVHVPDKTSANVIMQEIREDANKGMDLDAIVKDLKEKYHVASVTKKDGSYYVDVSKPITPPNDKNYNALYIILAVIIVVVLLLLIKIRK